MVSLIQSDLDKGRARIGRLCLLLWLLMRANSGQMEEVVFKINHEIPF
jgi:hypothetical protein